MSNSLLICYTKLSPNMTSPRNHDIDTITIHCVAANATIEALGNQFYNSGTKASSNYGIGTDGRIALYVAEDNRSWCSSSGANDNRAITIEVSNDGGAETGWHVSDPALNALINLIADICKRNGIKKLLWQADKSLIGQIDKQNMTVHRWFANKACCGDYLFNLHPTIAKKVNTILEGNMSDWKEIINAVSSNAEEWETAISAAVNIANLDTDLGALEIFKFLPELIVKIATNK